MVLMNKRLQLLVDGQFGEVSGTRSRHISPPAIERLAPLLQRDSFVIRDIIDLATKGVKRGHSIALVFGQYKKSQRKIGCAPPRDRAAFLHSRSRLGGLFGTNRWQPASLPQRGIAL